MMKRTSIFAFLLDSVESFDLITTFLLLFPLEGMTAKKEILLHSKAIILQKPFTTYETEAILHAEGN